ncbi:hypothetical protein [Carnobacterium funditum]|uniref:hypothetical protein n=1 Tax=Carnobacterium funditum TaxID=2752 RepID=UPI0006917D7A|nr:hypothetical protein [Carnobacterium funditum]
MNQKGAILPSVVIFVFLITTVMGGTAHIYKNQMQQMMITENYYLIQTMISLSKAEVQRQLIESPNFKGAIFMFEDGKVEVSKTVTDSFTFIGSTKNTILNPIKISVFFHSDKELDDRKEWN